MAQGKFPLHPPPPEVYNIIIFSLLSIPNRQWSRKEKDPQPKRNCGQIRKNFWTIIQFKLQNRPKRNSWSKPKEGSYDFMLE